MLRNRDSASVMEMTQLTLPPRMNSSSSHHLKRRENDSISSADSGTVVTTSLPSPAASLTASSRVSSKSSASASYSEASASPSSSSSNMFVHGDVIWSQLQGKTYFLLSISKSSPRFKYAFAVRRLLLPFLP